MNIIEALQAHAEAQDTTYLLDGRMIYPDEIFSAEGFMPLLGRLVEYRLSRNLNRPDLQCGFAYTPSRVGVFKEVMILTGDCDVIMTDAIRLLALRQVAVDTVLMGKPGTVDLTPVYLFFAGKHPEQRNRLRDQQPEELTWPLAQQVRVT